MTVCLISTVANAELTPPSAEIGYMSGASVLGKDFTRSPFYVQPGWQYSFQGSNGSDGSSNAASPGTWETQLKFRAQINTQKILNKSGANSLSNDPASLDFSIRALSLSYTQGIVKITGGFQEIPWGETFGFPILDIINPRDYRDPLLLDPYWVRLPVASLNTQVFLDRVTVQAVFTPLPRNNYYPTPGSSFDPTRGIMGVTLSDQANANLGQIGFSSEWGGKISRLFENGLDVGLVYYHHWNRNPIYTLSGGVSPGAATGGSSALSTATLGADPTTLSIDGSIPTFTLSPSVSKVDTVGGTLSYSLDRWVIRADQAYHIGQPLPGASLGSVETGNQWQSVVGTDYTSDDEWTVGLQFQTTLNTIPSENRFSKWFSTRILKRMWNGKLEPELFFFAGIGNPDLWLQPKLTWNFSDAWSASLRADWIRYIGGGPADGYLWGVRDQSRFLLWLTWRV